MDTNRRCDVCNGELAFAGWLYSSAEKYECPLCALRAERDALRERVTTLEAAFVSAWLEIRENYSAKEIYNLVYPHETALDASDEGR